MRTASHDAEDVDQSFEQHTYINVNVIMKYYNREKCINIIISIKNVQSVSYPVVNASSTGINLVDNVAIYKSEMKAPGIRYLKIKSFV